LTTKRLGRRVDGQREAREVLAQNNIPPEIAQKIMKPVEEHDLAGLIAQQVCQMLSLQPSSVSIPSGATVVMDKKDARGLATAGPLRNPRGFANLQVVDQNLCKRVRSFDQATSDREGTIAFKTVHEPIAKIVTAPVKETTTAPSVTEPITKSAKRRQRAKARVLAAVPLNSQAPAQAGDLTTNGVKKSRSRRKALRSAGPNAVSKEEAKSVSQKSGATSAQGNPSTSSTGGHLEGRKQRRSASSSK